MINSLKVKILTLATFAVVAFGYAAESFANYGR